MCQVLALAQRGSIKSKQKATRHRCKISKIIKMLNSFLTLQFWVGIFLDLFQKSMQNARYMYAVHVLLCETYYYVFSYKLTDNPTSYALIFIPVNFLIIM